MKAMVDAKIDPWYSTYVTLSEDWEADYDYTVRKDPDDNTLSRENPSHQRYQYEDDVLAAYKNALMWCMTGDTRHAEKSIEILNAWADLVSFYGGGTEPLCAGLYGTPLVNAAEIMKHTYDGWAEEDLQHFSDMLVYPGYSNTTVPTQAISDDQVTFYWRTYMGDAGRHGNQGLLAWRTVMAIGIFLDNEIIYDRAMNNILGLPHREDDLPYPTGPPVVNPTPTYSNKYYNEYTRTSTSTAIADYGYDDQIQHYIYDNGQCQEFSRDQVHSSLGMGCIAEMMEIAWNQGDDIYSYLDDRVLKGLEFSAKYNLSDFQSYPDQLEPWEPESYYQKQARCGRWQSLLPNPWVTTSLTNYSRGEGVVTRPIYEMPVAHFTIREGKNEDAKWITRSRDYSAEVIGYEGANGTDAPGWGGLTFRRPEGCAGDPITGFEADVPQFALHQLGDVIEAANYDYFSGNAEGRTYHDTDTVNSGEAYRVSNGVDVAVCDLGGYCVVDMAAGEWITYTITVPETGLYNIAMNYASSSDEGKVTFSINEEDVTAEIALPMLGEDVSGVSIWKDEVVASDVLLEKGVQALRIHISGTDNVLQLKSLTLSEGSAVACTSGLSAVTPPSYITPGINFSFYQGTWSTLPDMTSLVADASGIAPAVQLIDTLADDNFAMMYSGYIDLGIDGEYSFYIASNESSELYIDDVLVVSNASQDTESVGTICLKEGYHTIAVKYFEIDGDAALNVMFEGPGVYKQALKDIYAIGACEFAAIELPDNVEDGIKYKLYEEDWSALPVFKNFTETERGVVDAINIKHVMINEDFGLLFNGYFSVPEDGDYTFYITSDDGSSLAIDDTRLVSGDDAETKTVTVSLAAGYHSIEVRYFQASSSSDLYLMYEGPSITKRVMSGFMTEPVAALINQVITFEAIGTKYEGEEDFVPVVTTNSGLDVNFSSTNESVATIVDGKVHLVGPGSVMILGTNDGNVDYTAGQSFVYFVVSAKLDQNITFPDIATKYIGDADFTPEASADSDLPIIFESYNLDVATIVDNQIHIIGVGQAIIKATQEGNYMYNSVYDAVYLTVEEAASINENTLTDVQLYPSPIADQLTIELPSAEPASLQMYDLTGKMIVSQDLSSSLSTVDMHTYDAGMYIIYITQNNKIFTQKLVKE